MDLHGAADTCGNEKFSKRFYFAAARLVGRFEVAILARA
jgi:hypothetical protein